MQHTETIEPRLSQYIHPTTLINDIGLKRVTEDILENQQ